MTYEVELPDGTVVEGIPDEMSHADARAYILKRRPDLAGRKADPVAKPGVVNEFKRGLERWLGESGTGVASAGGQEAANVAATQGVAHQKDIRQRRGEDPMEAVKRVYNAPDGGFFPAAGQFIRDMPRALAGQAPQFLTGLAAARVGAMAGAPFGAVGSVVGGALSAGATLLPSFTGANLEAQREAGVIGDVDRGAALAAAAGQTALEIGGTALVVGKRLVSQILKLPPEVIAQQAAKSAAKLAVTSKRSLLAAAGRGAGVAVGVEVPVEIAQQVMERAQAGLSLTDDDAMEAYGQSALGALQVAPGLGAVSGVSTRSGARQQVAAQDAQVRAQEAQAAAAAAAQQQAAHAEKLKDPAYLQQVEQDYKATEAQWRSMQGVKPGKNASPADVALYKDQQKTADAFFQSDVKPRLDAYNEARRAQPAAPRAPATPDTVVAAPQDGLFPPGAEGEAAPWKNLQGAVSSPVQDPAAPPADPVEAYTAAEQQVRGLEDLKEQQRDAVVQAAKSGDVQALARATRIFRQSETALEQATAALKNLPKPGGIATPAQLKRAQTALAKAIDEGDVDVIERLMPKVRQLQGAGATQEEALTPTNMAHVAAADQVVADEIADGREQAADKTALLDKEKASLQAIADKVKAGPAMDYPGARRQNRLDRLPPIDTSRTDQQTLFETPAMAMAQTGAGDVATKSRAELQADLQIARAAGDKTAAANAIEGIRDLKAHDAARKEAPDDTSAAPTGAAAVAAELAGTKMPPTVARRQAAGDAKALSFAKLVSVIARFNKGKAAPEERNVARNGVITNLIHEIEVATGAPMSAADRKAIQYQSHVLLDELIDRFGDTRNIVSVGSKEQPAYESPQNFRGEFRQDGAPGPNVEAEARGARTFGSPYAAAQSIMEGLNSIRNAAINNRPLPGTNTARTLTQSRTTPEALMDAVEKARTNPALDPAAGTLLGRIEENMEAVSAAAERREAIAAWLHRASTGKIDPKDTADISLALDALERGKRSDQEVVGGKRVTTGGKVVQDVVGPPVKNAAGEEERNVHAVRTAAGDRVKTGGTTTTVGGKIKTAKQGDMFPAPEQGDIFATRGEFEKFMASGALHEMRVAMGKVRETASRAFKRTAPMRARIKDLEANRETLKILLRTQIQVRDENVAAARSRVGAAERALRAKINRLNAELQGLQVEYDKAKLAFDFAAKNSQEISEKIAHNVLAFGGAPSMVQVAQDVYAAKKAYAELIGTQDLDFDTRLRLSKDVIAALEAHAKAVNKAATVDRNVQAFLNHDLDLQVQLADELQEMADTRPFMDEARAALDSAYREQQARPDVKAAPVRLANAKKAEIAAVKAGNEVIGDVNFELSLIDKELNQLAREVNARMKEAGAVELDPTAVRDAKAADQDAAGRARIAAEQKRAEALNALPGRVVTHEAKRAALAALEDMPAKIANADAKAADKDLPVTTRHKAKRTADALRKQATLTAGVLSEDPETVAETLQGLNIRLGELVAKRDHQRQRANEEGIAPKLRAVRRKEVRETQTTLTTMAHLASGLAGRPEVVEKMTPEQQADMREEEDIFDAFNNAVMVGTGGTGALPARRRGPLVRKGVTAGNIRTGDTTPVLERQGPRGYEAATTTTAARRLPPRNPITQSGSAAPVTATQAVSRANADTAEYRQWEADTEAAMQQMVELQAQLSALEDRRTELAEEPATDKAARRAQLKDLDAQIEGITERMETAQEIAEREAPAKISTGPVYRTVTTTGQGMQAAAVARVAEKTMEGWTNTPEIEVVETETDLPPRLQDQAAKDGMTGKIPGLFDPDTGKVYLVASNLHTGQDVALTIVHEVAGHYGLRNMMGGEYAPTMNRLYNGNDSIKTQADAKMKADPKLSREVAVEEVLAEMAETMPARSGAPAHLSRIFHAVKTWLAKAFGYTKVSDADVRQIVANARRHVKRGAPNTPGPQGPKGTVYRSAAVDTTSAIGKLAERHIAEKPSIRDFFKNNLGLAFETAVIDMRAAPIKALQFGDADIAENAAYHIRKADARMAHVYAALTEGPMQLTKDSQGNHIIQAGGGPSAQELFQAIGRVPGLSETDKARTVQVYLTARRAQRVGVTTLDLGATTQADIDAVMAQVKADPALQAALKDVQEIYNAYNKGLIDFLADTGAIPKKRAVELLAHDDYVPYYRVTSTGIAQLVFEEGNVLNVGNLRYQPYLQALKAGDQKLLPLNEAVIRNTMLLTDMGMRNMASKETAYALQAMGAIPGKKNSMRIHRGDGPANVHAIRFHQEPAADEPEGPQRGHRYLVVDTEGTVAESIPSEMISRGLEGSHVTLPAFMKAAGWFGDVLRAGVTRNPAYVARQLFRDPFAAALTGGLDRGVLGALTKSIAAFGRQSIDGPSDTSLALIRKGVVQSGIFTGDPDDLSKFSLQLAGGDQGAIKKLFAMADRAAMRADSVTREQVYEDVIKRGGSARSAELAAIEMMNFHKRGLSPTVQYASRLIPFFNAQIQGLNVLYKAATGQMSAEKQLQIREKFFNRAMMLTGLSLVYALAMEDDETYKNAKPRDRYSNFFVPLGGDVPLKLPIPFEVGLLFKAIPEMLLDILRGKFNDQEQKAARALILNQVPGLSGVFLPAAFKPALEVRMNKNLFTDREIETDAQQGVAPQERFTAHTTEFTKMISATLQHVPVNFMQLSPVQLEHLIRGHLGSLPLAVAALTNEIFGSNVERPLRKLSETPVVGTFFQDRYGGGATDALYAKIKATKEAAATIKKMEADGRRADAKAYREHVLNVLQLPDLNAAEGKLRNIAKEEKAIRASNLPAEVKRARIERLDALREALSNRYMDAINRIAQ